MLVYDFKQKFFCVDVLRSQSLELSFDQIGSYMEIPENIIKNIKENYDFGMYSNIEEIVKPFIKNKANLSAQKGSKGIIEDI